MRCNLCPVNCNADRSLKVGACGCGNLVTLCRVAPHFWEEPCISGTAGSGAVFFGGCNLHCRFCQNYEISNKAVGVEVDGRRLADIFLYINDSGAANINLVSPSQYSDVIAKTLSKVKHKLNIPVVYNTNAYEKVSALKRLEGLADVYLPDLKFYDGEFSRNMCGREDYFAVASAAAEEMKRQRPQNVYDADGYIQEGIIIRHLVLPGHIEDSKKILDWVSRFDRQTSVSLMAQYFPPRPDDKFPELNRRLYPREYQSVKEYFFNVGLSEGYSQEVSSATEEYVPNFDVAGVKRLLDLLPRYNRMSSAEENNLTREVNSETK